MRIRIEPFAAVSKILDPVGIPNFFFWGGAPQVSIDEFSPAKQFLSGGTYPLGLGGYNTNTITRLGFGVGIRYTGFCQRSYTVLVSVSQRKKKVSWLTSCLCIFLGISNLSSPPPQHTTEANFLNNTVTLQNRKQMTVLRKVFYGIGRNVIDFVSILASQRRLLLQRKWK